MKLIKLAVVLLLGVMLVTGVACAPELMKPDVNYLPQGWYLDAEDRCSCGESTMLSTGCFGAILYRLNTRDWDNQAYVFIYYMEASEELKKLENDGDGLSHLIIYDGTEEYSVEHGTMYIDDHIAGFAKECDPESGYYRMRVYCLKDSTFYKVLGVWNISRSDDEQDVMAVIESIVFGELERCD